MSAEATQLPPKIWRRTPIGKWLRLIPRQKQLRNSWLHKKLGDKFLRSEYWEPSRKTIAKGFAIGGFWAMIPMPWQMVPSGLCAVFLRANIPLALLGVWITNPITHPFIIVFQLWLGEWVLNAPSSLSILQSEGVLALIKHAPAPIITGALLSAVVWSALSYFVARFCYGFSIDMIVKSYEKKKHKQIDEKKN
ncbi:MAG: DUF2062 domain-containing protein [Helicobacteraceae bacterium]|jgi:uncharacterized protein (DUF2062 family)|nr:DUF2062 domain-containing protein [Helicobacteraceae bacterium]